MVDRKLGCHVQIVIDSTQVDIELLFTDVVFQYLAFPCGLIRGALANLGIVCVVTAEVNTIPACKYTFYWAATTLLR